MILTVSRLTGPDTCLFERRTLMFQGNLLAPSSS